MDRLRRAGGFVARIQAASRRSLLRPLQPVSNQHSDRGRDHVEYSAEPRTGERHAARRPATQTFRRQRDSPIHRRSRPTRRPHCGPTRSRIQVARRRASAGPQPLTTTETDGTRTRGPLPGPTGPGGSTQCRRTELWLYPNNPAEHLLVGSGVNRADASAPLTCTSTR